MDRLTRAICELNQKLGDAISAAPGAAPGAGGGIDLTVGAGSAIGTDSNPVDREDDEVLRVLNANPNRIGVIIHNHSSGELWVSLDETQCGPRYYTFKLKPGEVLHMDERQYQEIYKGAMTCRWDDQTGPEADSLAMVTEMFWTT